MRTPQRTSPRHLMLAAGAAALFGALALVSMSATPALAEGQDRNSFEGRGTWQERGRRDEHWRPEHRYNGYYSAPPPVYVAPYYGQPGASLNFNFPLFR